MGWEKKGRDVVKCTPEEGLGATPPAERGAQGLSDRVIPDRPFIEFLRETCQQGWGWG